MLTDELYVGKYKVAGVEDQVGECKIIDDQLFREVNELRMRYENGNEAKRLPMSEDRRRAKIEKVFREYLGFLETE